MKTKQRKVSKKGWIPVVVIGVLAPSSAFAYLDPGSIGYVFQLVGVGFLGGLYMIKMYWGRIRDFLRRDKK